MNKHYDFVVVGAGISGLSAAWKLQQRGLKGVVLESTDKVGGCIETVCHQGLHQEFGAHSGFNSYRWRRL